MPAAFRAASTGDVQNMLAGATLTLPRPTGTQAGDLLVAMIIQDRDASVKTGIPAPAGWTQVGNNSGLAVANGVCAVYTYVATGSDPGSWGWVNGASNDVDTHGTMIAVSDTDGTIVSGPTWQGAGGSNTTAYTAPSVTGVDGGLLVCGFFRSDSANGSGSFTMAAPLTEQVDFNRTGSWTGLGVGTQALTAGGATGTRTATNTDAARWSTVSLVVAPAAAGGVDLTAGVGDAVSAGDGVATARQGSRAASDNTPLLDAVAAASALSRLVADTPAVTDSVSAGAGVVRAASDSVGVSDSAQTTLSVQYDAAVGDILPLADAAAVTTDAIKAPADQVPVSDIPSPQTGAQRPAADTAGVTDSATSGMDRARPASDDVQVADDAALVRTAERQPVDAVQLADHVGAQRAGAGSTDVADDVTLTDSAEAFRASAAPAADPIGLSDTADTGRGRLAAAGDTASLEDAVDAVRTRIEAVADSIALEDSVETSPAGEAAAAAIDQLGIADAVDAGFDAGPSYLEPAGRILSRAWEGGIPARQPAGRILPRLWQALIEACRGAGRILPRRWEGKLK